MSQIVGPSERIDFVRTTTLGIGAPGPNISNVDEIIHTPHKTIIPIVAFPITLIDANVGAGALIYTFPKGLIRIHAAFAKAINETTTSALASTMNASKTLSVGVGSVQTTTQASGTLVTTEQDIINAFTITSSATINVAGVAPGTGIGPSTPLILDGTTTAIRAFLNCGVPTATDIDGDATTTWDGFVELTWSLGGAL